MSIRISGLKLHINHDTPSILIYDGDCPFCRRYVKYLRLKEAVPTLKIYNARDSNSSELIQTVQKAGKSLDDGMALIIGDEIFHGDDCIHVLSLLSSRSTVFNKINYMIFKSRRRAKILYPVLRFFRNLTLKILGRAKIDP